MRGLGHGNALELGHFQGLSHGHELGPVLVRDQGLGHGLDLDHGLDREQGPELGLVQEQEDKAQPQS